MCIELTEKIIIVISKKTNNFLYGIHPNTDFKTKKKKLSNINTLQISNKDEPKRGALQAFQAGDCRKTGDGEQYAEHKTAEHRC